MKISYSIDIFFIANTYVLQKILVDSEKELEFDLTTGWLKRNANGTFIGPLRIFWVNASTVPPMTSLNFSFTLEENTE